MDPIVVDVDLTPADWDALSRYLQTRLRRQTSARDLLLNGLLAAIPAATILYAVGVLYEQLSMLSVGIGLLLTAFCILLLRRRARTAVRPTASSATLGRSRLEIDAAGIRAIREHQSGFTDWIAIQAIDETAEHIFLPLDRLVAYVIPKRQIRSFTPDALVAQMRRWHAERRAQGPVSTTLEAAPPSTLFVPGERVPESSPVRGFWSDLRSNLLVGMRVFWLRRARTGDIVASFDQVVALLCILLGFVAVLDRATAGADAEFNTWGVYTWFAFLLSGLWICALIARSMSEHADTRPLLVAALATAPWVVIVTTVFRFILELGANDELLAYAVLAIVLWAALRTIHVVYGSLRRPALIVIAVSLIVFSMAQNYLYFDSHLWTEASEEDDDPPKPTAQEAEAIFFDQQARIDEAVDQLEPQRPGITDLYYVGFAGDGYQRVFRREALLAQRVFAERLGTGPRSLELINDYQDRESFPLGTQVSLRYALSEIGKVMDPKEDMLVLLLTSHGSREGGIYIRNGVSTIDSDLPPDEVRSALDDAGIRWRIVIVSACYSGIFVEPLKTDTTMILTAADSQHTSFGCADDRDLTYFGEAFLRDSLPNAPSLQAAFEQARKEIAEREQQETLTPSNPQMWVGASMAKKLATLGRLPLPSVQSH